VILSSRDAQQGHLSSETRRAFENLWKLQFTRGQEAGAWAWLYFDLAPWESEGAAYFGAALAAVAVGVAPDDYAGTSEIQERIELLRAYLLQDWENHRPFDQVMLLWASSELGGLLTREEQHSIIAEIVRLQRGDGGWSLTSLGEWDGREGYVPPRGSDGYATALVAFAMQKTGVSSDHGDLSQALSWLRSNQDPTTGRWRSSSLNRERDPASDRGLLMSDAATAFAVLALTQAGGL
jgi:squalene-hopene/tetraprenyl-beta-curcumene cyclase